MLVAVWHGPSMQTAPLSHAIDVLREILHESTEPELLSMAAAFGVCLWRRDLLHLCLLIPHRLRNRWLTGVGSPAHTLCYESHQRAKRVSHDAFGLLAHAVIAFDRVDQNHHHTLDKGDLSALLWMYVSAKCKSNVGFIDTVRV